MNHKIGTPELAICLVNHKANEVLPWPDWPEMVINSPPLTPLSIAKSKSFTPVIIGLPVGLNTSATSNRSFTVTSSADVIGLLLLFLRIVPDSMYFLDKIYFHSLNRLRLEPSYEATLIF